MLAWVFGVILTLNCTEPVVTGTGVPPEKLIVSLAGLETAEKYRTAPLSEVILTSLKPAWVPAAKVTVKAVMLSVPETVCTVKASKSVIADSGATVLLPGSVPSPKVVTFGVTGDPVGTTPVAA